MTKCVLITGAAKRVGREIALSLAKQGWSIALHYHHSEQEASALKQELETLGVRSITLKADLQNEQEVSTLITRTINELGTIDCLINNASAFINDTVVTHSRTNWDMHMETNLRAPVLLMQQFAVQMPQGIQGNIINMLDYCVWKLPEQFFSYAISKSALWTATQMLAIALAPSIRVNAIGPGHLLPNHYQTQESFATLAARSPLGHSTSIEEVCNAITFILSTPSLTGQMIALDSGLHLANQPYGFVSKAKD